MTEKLLKAILNPNTHPHTNSHLAVLLFFRALMFVSNNFSSTIQEMVLVEDDINLLALVNRELHRYIDNMEEAKYVITYIPYI